jgi:hypothetical protein
MPKSIQCNECRAFFPSVAESRPFLEFADGQQSAAESETRPSFVIDGADLYIDWLLLAAKYRLAATRRHRRRRFVFRSNAINSELTRFRVYTAAVKLILLYERVLALV